MSLSRPSVPFEYHVSLQGRDDQPGTPEAPLRSIQAAALLAQHGDTITVHEGVYRERVDPPRGGASDDCRITYRAAPGERVEICGSERAHGWEREAGDVWRLSVPNTYFGDFNPFAALLQGHWFYPRKRLHHRGAVYLDGHWLAEATDRDELFKPVEIEPRWFAEVSESDTKIWAQFPGLDPNQRETEISVREAVFYPSKTGVNYLTVRGFILTRAATPWSPPTTEQVGLLGTNWSRGWIIEGNTVRYSLCAGITLGKYDDPEDCGDQPVVERTDGRDTYHGTIERALAKGWRIGEVGDHIVRDNTVSHCEMAGIAGSLGALRSRISGNVIHDIYTRRLFFGFEMAGIKFHGAIDTEIVGNRVFNCYRGIWLDWMSQGTRVSGNLLYGNGDVEDLYIEVNHGPLLVDNNLFLSGKSVTNWSHGSAFAHNLIAGEVVAKPELGRVTPFHKPHSTDVVDLLNIEMGDDRFISNVLIHPAGSATYDDATWLPLYSEDNLYLAGAQATRHETSPQTDSGCKPSLQVEDQGGEVFVNLVLDPEWGRARPRTLVDTARLGRARASGAAFENPDGSPIRIDTDYFGAPRNPDNPFPGPIEPTGPGSHRIRVWPR